MKATQASERQPYDVVRQALKEVELDSSRRVELDDYVGVSHPIQSNLHSWILIYASLSQSYATPLLLSSACLLDPQNQAQI